ncbi:MAG: adenine deaminase [Peptococcaceae bacterium]|nr:adenine deaminase [Peptococcaceae bacterium]
MVLKNCNIVNVFTLEIVQGDIAIEGDTIIAIGAYQGEKEIDVAGRFVAPGFIDGHVHIESSMVTPSRFAEAVIPCGTTSVIADPHEIANVCGKEGILFMIDDSKNVPLDVHIMLPSCVPAVDFDESGAVVDAEMIKELINTSGVLGLGEVMCYPDVVAGGESIMEKIEAAGARTIDGHAPRLTGKDLASYVISGTKTDHECATVEEAMEKLRLGMYVHIRNGTASQEIKHLIKGITLENMRHAMFCTDDRHPHDILSSGHINHALRIAVESGLNPVIAVVMATYNPAECYGLKHVGAVAPGYRADLVVLDDLESFRARQVFKNGVLVAENGKPLFASRPPANYNIMDTMKLNPITESDLKIELASSRVRVILPVPDSVETKKAVREVAVEGGCFAYSKDYDICKVAAIERHKSTGHIGLGLVEGFGVRDGAIAQSISHDSHNIIAVGDNDKDMVIAVNELAKGRNGGIVVVYKGEVIKKLELPVAGLMSLDPLSEVETVMEDIEKAAYDTLSMSAKNNPFMVLGFLALPVIPELRVTTKGIFDVTEFRFVDISAD